MFDAFTLIEKIPYAERFAAYHGTAFDDERGTHECMTLWLKLRAGRKFHRV